MKLIGGSYLIMKNNDNYIFVTNCKVKSDILSRFLLKGPLMEYLL